MQMKTWGSAAIVVLNIPIRSASRTAKLFFPFLKRLTQIIRDAPSPYQLLQNSAHDVHNCLFLLGNEVVVQAYKSDIFLLYLISQAVDH